MNKVFLVVGESNTYDEYNKWIVKAFMSSGEAQLLVDELQTVADKLKMDEEHPLDPKHEWALRNHGYYTVEGVELVE